jgi:hypothetical protein
MGYSTAIATASAADITVSITSCIGDLFHPYWLDADPGDGQATGSWNLDQWIEVQSNMSVATGYKKYFSLPSGSTATDPDNYCTVGDVDTWINYNASRYYFNPADSVGWYGLSGSLENAPCDGHSGSLLDPDASTINEWTASYGPTNLSAVGIYDPDSE